MIFRVMIARIGSFPTSLDHLTPAFMALRFDRHVVPHFCRCSSSYVEHQLSALPLPLSPSFVLTFVGTG